MTYIARTLTVNKLETDQRSIHEDEISSLLGPIIILGEPGIGKSSLTTSIEVMTNAKRVNAGTFSRSENLTPYTVPEGGRLIIDGLDEISSAGGVSALDIVLKKLDHLGRPKFILSCRAADWQGSPDKWKIEQDYGAKPVTLHIEPFSRQEAVQFLESYDGIDAASLLDQLANRGLEELSGNPLTLGLLAELALEGQGIPDNRTDLIDRASRLLVREENPAHQGSTTAQARIEDLLLSAGAIAAHLLISGAVGISTGARDKVPLGFIHASEILNLQNAPLAEATLDTRLFRSEGEGFFFPIHRVIAEYWGGYWLARQLHNGLSERRVFKALEFGGGVPSALRGVHAWLGHFCPAVADRCIKADPYGVLRYGETADLPPARASLLLTSLASLAKEDPYFRSEDWGTRAVSGLARPELKDQIIEVVLSPDRHFHLSSLLLEALPGSTLTDLIVPELLSLINDSNAAYAERHHAAEALIASKTSADWPQIVGSLGKEGGEDNTRLALEIVAQLYGNGFSFVAIVDALIARVGIGREEKHERIGGLDFLLVKRLTPVQCAGVLDEIARRIRAAATSPHWWPNHAITTSIQRLVAKALLGTAIEPTRFWSWLRYVHSNTGYSTDTKDEISEYLREHHLFRQAVQREAIYDQSIDGGPWMAIVHELPQASAGLSVSQDDAVLFVDEIRAKGTLTESDVIRWKDLIQSQGHPDKYSDRLQTTIADSTRQHVELAQKWEELQRPPRRDYEKENERRQERYRRKQAATFALHRQNFAKVIEEIRNGTQRGALHSLALAYLNRYSDLNHDVEPIERLKGWVGEEIAEAATTGFIACLSAEGLPTLREVVEIRKEGKHWTVEPILMCGAAELVRQNEGLEQVKDEVARAILAVWWDMPEFNASKLGADLEAQLEARVFGSDDAVESFLCSVIEPQIADDKEHVSSLYRVGREDRFRPFAGTLALKWLRAYPTVRLSTQFELLQIALFSGPRKDLLAVTKERLGTDQLSNEIRKIWAAAGFLLEVENAQSQIREIADEDRDIFWSIVKLPRLHDRSHLALSIVQLEFMIKTFATLWPPAAMPGSGWVSDHEPWDASNYLRSSIDKMGSNPSAQASDALDRLLEEPACANYESHIRHVRAQQLRLRRDTEYVAPSFEDVRNALSDGEPGTIDDMKGMLLDRLDSVQKYLRDADTDSWEAFWSDKDPKIENTCRDRLLDALRARTSSAVDLVPECLMPERNRCDILALHRGKGLPIEIKGQWHKDVWDASQTQLEDQYGRDWRAEGRGIYLVLWFGVTTNKNLTAHPDGLPPPSTPQELREMLAQRLRAPERGLIDVVVIDVSKPPPKPKR